MGLGHGASIVRSGLDLHLDAANIKSYLGTGTAWNDTSGNGRNGILVNGVSYSASNNGHFLQDNSNDYIDSGYTSPTSNFTITLWAKRTSTSYWAVLWANEHWNNTLGYVAYFSSSTTLTFGRAKSISMAATIPDSSKWSYYSFSISNAGQYLLHYNGSLISTLNSTISTSIPNTIKFGTRHQNSGVGVLDTRFGDFSTISVYNKVLSTQEIKQNFESTRGRYSI